MKTANAYMLQDDVRLFTARVMGHCDDRFMILAEGVSSLALRAAGCLLQPEPGDTVLTVVAEDGTTYILNVLARTESADTARISAPGNLMLLKGEQISIEPRKALNISSPDFNLEACSATANTATLKLQGSSMESRFLKITTIARTIESVSDLLMQKTGRCYRRVQEFEEATIGRLRMLVDGLFSVSSKSASMKAEKRFKVDAEKIHLG